MLLVVVSNQLTINPKHVKCLLWDPDPHPSLPSRTYTLPVPPLQVEHEDKHHWGKSSNHLFYQLINKLLLLLKNRNNFGKMPVGITLEKC